jgi:hypothetical protein
MTALFLKSIKAKKDSISRKAMRKSSALNGLVYVNSQDIKIEIKRIAGKNLIRLNSCIKAWFTISRKAVACTSTPGILSSEWGTVFKSSNPAALVPRKTTLSLKNSAGTDF